MGLSRRRERPHLCRERVTHSAWSRRFGHATINKARAVWPSNEGVASESDSSSRSRFALSLSADGESTPTIPSGKYDGRSAADVLAQDPQYVEWILAQPRVHDRSPQLVQFFSRGEDTDSMRVTCSSLPRGSLIEAAIF